MYILEMNQEEIQTDLAVFETIEEGREFLKKIPSYELIEEEGFVYENIFPEKLPNYLEIEFNNNIVPISRFMFPNKSKIEIFWKEVPNLSNKGNGLVEGVTRVDAYSVNNEEVKEYISNRESKFEIVKEYLENKGFDVKREFLGSEDGEALLYSKKNVDEWKFMFHLDPIFCENEEVLKEVEEIILEE